MNAGDGVSERKLRIGFLCSHNPLDRNSFSGTAYYAYHALKNAERAGELAELRLLGAHCAPTRIRRYAAAMKSRLSLSKPELRYETEHDLGLGLDWVVSLVSTDLAVSLAPRLRAPLIHVTDATPKFLRDFYGYDLPAEKDVTERELIQTAALTIYSSRYMSERARLEFGDELALKFRSIPFGANLDRIPMRSQTSNELPGSSRPANLLFIGKEWQRKGGSLALDALARMRDDGIAARLTIIGCDPPEAAGVADVTVIPFLDKNNPKDSRRFDEILDGAHLMVLPTRADCTPMVIAEANAHSLPVIVTSVGGIPSLVTEGVNGRLMPIEAGPVEWGNAIRGMLSDPEAYCALRETSYRHFRDRLHWSAWARDLIANLVAS